MFAKFQTTLSSAALCNFFLARPEKVCYSFLLSSLLSLLSFFFAITCGLLRIGHVRVRKGVRECGRTGMCYASTSVFVSFLPLTLAQACVDNTCVTVNLCVLCVQQGNFCLHISLHGRCDPTKLGSCCQPLGVLYKIAANLPKQFANLLQIRVNTDMTQSTPTAACEIDKDRQQHKTVCMDGGTAQLTCRGL